MTGDTLLQALVRQLDAAGRGSDGVARPAVILWPDPERQWLGLMPQFRVTMPLFTLGAYDIETRTGPSIWLRCIVDRTVPGVLGSDVTPIFYLPNVWRQQLRSGADCPIALQPLVELQYRGTTWHQKNGREWTVEAFLISHLRLEIAQDLRTREALLRALPRLGDVDVGSLQDRRLDAEDFDGLAVGDPVRDLLRWMSSAKSFRAGMPDAEWASFVSLCRSSFGFSPEEDDVAVAATRLAEGGGKWDQVWARFCEAPRLYPGVVIALRGARHSLLTGARDPARNTAREDSLRKDLRALLVEPHTVACSRIEALDAEHAPRREQVWALMGESPLAVALEPLARLASLASKTPGGATASDAAAEYADDGWRCDRALLDAVSLSVPPADHDLIAKVARNLYEPWADASARRFQELIGRTRPTDMVKDAPVPSHGGACVLFVDGLRLDLSMTLVEKLRARGLAVEKSHRIAPLPTVTATAKPAIVPLVGAFRAGHDASDFQPVFTTSGEPVIAQKLRDEMHARGVAVLDADALAGPENERSIGWMEIGHLDERGHDLGVEMVRHIDEELERIVEQTICLTDLGWRVKIVTDHGWLLLPGGLPKHQLPAYLTESRWSRCATVKPGTKAELDSYGWHWDPYVSIVSPPGIHAFQAGHEYAHGGISLQECVVPEITVKTATPKVIAKLDRVEWRGMRCRVTVRNAATGLRLDLRTNRKDATSTAAAAVRDVMDGRADLLVLDDANEGKAAFVVLLDEDGGVADYQATTIGGD
ncbi:MAG TPA: BREX-1 system phosphatase PglZ type B [Gemmatimonadaceae bacterium]|nr:MAG: BREX-1 system phosphatase PglZ type B [Acidobacteriota bacterium]HTD84313.1 BREX-1 system phosphatase PglZ type B [Gemmatimonadaceae bacterium]